MDIGDTGKRTRRSKAEMAQWRADLIAALREGPHPMTLRQLFYRCVSRKLLAKDENAYTNLSYEMVNFRMAGKVPFEWLADHTRSSYGPHRGYTGIEGAKDLVRFELQDLRDRPDYYKRDYWNEREYEVQVWCEKDALASLLHDVVDEFQVGLYVARGFSSLTFTNEAADEINDIGKPVTVLYLADYDPSGVTAMQSGMRRLRELCQHPVTVEHIAVTREQIEAWDLPTRPTKSVKSHGKNWTDPNSVELDAIPPNQFQQLVGDALARHLPPEAIERMQEVADEERKQLRDWIDGLLEKVEE